MFGLEKIRGSIYIYMCVCERENQGVNMEKIRGGWLFSTVTTLLLLWSYKLCYDAGVTFKACGDC